MTATALGTPGDCRSVRDRERARAGTSRGGYRTASRSDAEGRPERADLYSMQRWRPPAERRKYSAIWLLPRRRITTQGALQEMAT
jgi:hypothetical protein